MISSPSRLRFPLLAIAILALILGALAGLMRLGWALPTINSRMMAAHGPLMVTGFLGTLISLERAVALRKRWAYAAPALAGLGGLFLIAGLPDVVSKSLFVLGSLGLVAIFASILRQHFASFTLTMAVGSLAWLAGNLLWLAGGQVSQVVPWWAGFLVLTIAGERLELGRMARIPRGVMAIFAGACTLIGLGLLASLFDPGFGVRLSGVGTLILAFWLLRYDIARRTIRKPGLTRFIALCMLSGYFWLAAGGLLAIFLGGVTGGALYDARLHSIFLGFVFSMIFGHATIIFPAILGNQIQFSRRFYAHLVILHLSLLLRLAGDLGGSFPVRRWGGMLNALAILIFLINMVVMVLNSRKLAQIPLGTRKR